MSKKAFILLVLLVGLDTLLYGQAPPTFVFSPASIPDGLYGSAYGGLTLTVSGGTAPYTFSVTGGTLPPGIGLGADGTLSGTPTAAGSYSFTVTAQDNSPSPGPYMGSQPYTMN